MSVVIILSKTGYPVAFRFMRGFEIDCLDEKPPGRSIQVSAQFPSTVLYTVVLFVRNARSACRFDCFFSNGGVRILRPGLEGAILAALFTWTSSPHGRVPNLYPHVYIVRQLY
jgi:hypothetical protein